MRRGEGSALGLGVLVTVSTAANAGTAAPAAVLADKVHVTLSAGTVLLGFCLIAVLLTAPLRFHRFAPRSATA